MCHLLKLMDTQTKREEQADEQTDGHIYRLTDDAEMVPVCQPANASYNKILPEYFKNFSV